MRAPHFLFGVQGQDDLEQIAVHHQVELAALDLHEALGDVQAEAVALGVAAGIAPDEPLHELVGGDASSAEALSVAR